jgi:hypothetical protein
MARKRLFHQGNYRENQKLERVAVQRPGTVLTAWILGQIVSTGMVIAE